VSGDAGPGDAGVRSVFGRRDTSRRFVSCGDRSARTNDAWISRIVLGLQDIAKRACLALMRLGKTPISGKEANGCGFLPKDGFSITTASWLGKRRRGPT
jgi:hypothetical protein